MWGLQVACRVAFGEICFDVPRLNPALFESAGRVACVFLCMLGASSVQAWTLCVGVLAALASLLSAIELISRFAFSRAAQLMDYNGTCRHVESFLPKIKKARDQHRVLCDLRV